MMAGNNDKVYDKKSQRYAKDNRTAVDRWLMTNNKRLRSTFCIIEAVRRPCSDFTDMLWRRTNRRIIIIIIN